jgi:hypothetical protein
MAFHVARGPYSPFLFVQDEDCRIAAQFNMHMPGAEEAAIDCAEGLNTGFDLAGRDTNNGDKVVEWLNSPGPVGRQSYAAPHGTGSGARRHSRHERSAHRGLEPRTPGNHDSTSGDTIPNEGVRN